MQRTASEDAGISSPESKDQGQVQGGIKVLQGVLPTRKYWHAVGLYVVTTLSFQDQKAVRTNRLVTSVCSTMLRWSDGVVLLYKWLYCRSSKSCTGHVPRKVT